jgi:hypothetical protein
MLQGPLKEDDVAMEGKCNALLIADRVIKEDNGKRGIIGSFNTFSFPSFPSAAPPFFIYANLDDFEGEVEFSVSIVREVAELVIFSAGGEMRFGQAGGEAELIIPVAGVVFPKEGNYNLVLKVGHYQQGSRRIIVNRMPTQQQIGGT